jgi:hypothetical protein
MNFRLSSGMRSIAFASLAAALAGAFVACGPVTGIVRFDTLATCPHQPPTGPESLPPGPTKDDLQCALSELRQVIIPTPAQNLLAAKISAELAAGETVIAVSEKLAGEGKWWAERMLFGATNDPVGLYLLAVNMGQLIIRHPLKALKDLPKVERSLKKAVAGAPDFDKGGPLRVLGMLYVKAPAWPQGIGDSDKGLELLEQAVERHPDHPLNHFFLARALWDVDGDSAREQIAAQLAITRNLLASKDWGYSAGRWNRDIADLMKDAKLR